MSTYAVDPNSGEGALRTIKRWLAGNPSGAFVDPNPGEGRLATLKRILKQGGGGPDPALKPTAAYEWQGSGTDATNVVINTSDSIQQTGNPITNFHFDWGDGSSSDQSSDDPDAPIMLHTYASAGNYFGTLTVSAQDGQTDSVTGTITMPGSDEFTPVP